MTDEAGLVRPRRWWAALLLTIVSPVVGYLYVGRPWRAAAFAAVVLAILLAVRNGLGGAAAQPLQWFAFVAIAIFASLFALVDVVRIAWRGRPYRLGRWNRIWLYVLAGFAFIAAAEVIANPSFGGFLAARSFSAASSSMEPTLHVGDYFIADMRAYESLAPQPGDIVILDLSGDGREFWIKRVVAGPGDKVALVDGALVVNDQPVRRDEVARAPARVVETLADGRSYTTAPNATGNREADQMEPQTVAAGAFFVLGDNRGNSLDSRYPSVGAVPRARILGRATFVWWSMNRARIGATLF